MKITSAQNPLIKKVHKLSTQKKTRRDEGLTVLDGMHLLTEYLRFNNEPQEILISEKLLKNPESEAFKGREYTEIPDDLMAKIAPTQSPSGILSIISIPNARKDPGQAGMTDHYSLFTDNCKKVLLLDHLQDPGNVGTIIRSSVASGFNAVLSLNSSEIWSPKVLRAAQGAHFYPIYLEEISSAEKLTANSQALKALSWYALSCDDQSQNLFDTPFQEPLGLIVGNEGAGISNDVEHLKAKSVHIPMKHGFESLNAGVSASVAMFHVQ